MIEQEIESTLNKFLTKNKQSQNLIKLDAGNGISIVNQRPNKTTEEGRNKFTFNRNTIKLLCEDKELARLEQKPGNNTFLISSVAGYEEKITEALPVLEALISE